MRRFCPATIIDKYQETEDSIVLTLGVTDDVADSFRYRQGQHVPVSARINDTVVRRTYSICSSVAENQLKLGIRVQEGGVFSNYAADELQVGDTLEIMQPSGRFFTDLDPAQSKRYAAFVAGSGITPLLSIVKSSLETEPGSSFVVFYGNRRKATTMFVEELMALKNLYRERLSLHFVMSQEPSEIELYNGRMDGNKLRALHNAFLEHAPPDDVFLCGPNPMIDELTEALTGLGYNESNIHSERFRPGLRGEATPRPALRATPEEGTQVDVVMDGQRQTFRMTREHASVLEAAQAGGMELPFSCKGGVCSTCRAKLTKGDVEMAVNYALEPWELEKGFILTCQSSPTSDAIEIDFDQT